MKNLKAICLLSIGLIVSCITFGQTQASSILFTANTGTQFTIGWTSGVSTVGRMVFVKATNIIEAATPVNGTNYTANSIFSNGTQIGATGWHCVYKVTGAGTSVTITGLTPGTVYRAQVFEFTGTAAIPTFVSGTNTGNPRSQITAPTTQVSGIQFSNVGLTSMNLNWTNGNGTNRVIFRTTNLVASAPNISNGSTYVVGTTYSTNWTCVHNNGTNSFTDNNLAANTSYRYRVYEYSDHSNSINRRIYLTTTATGNPNDQSTLDYTAPTTQASNIEFTAVSQNSISFSWASGNGSESIVFISATDAGTAAPQNNTSYYAENNYGSGDMELNGWYCVYKGIQNSVSVYNLETHLTYRVMVCSYNGQGGLEKYNIAEENNNPVNVFTSASRIWNGTSWLGGTPSSGDDAELLGDYNLDANINCNNLTINTGYTLNVQAGRTVTVNNDLINYGTLTLFSPLSSGVTASLIVSGVSYNYGINQIQRYITPGTLQATNYHWHFMSSPVSSILAEKVFKGDYGYLYAEPSNTWATITQFGTNLGVGEGYMIKTLAAKTALFTGTFNSGDITVDLSNTGSDANHGYNLVGNPYPSAIDWNDGGWTKTNIGSTFWVWDPNNERYMSFDGSVGTNGGSRYIPAMQGFFVKVSDGSASGSLGFSNSIRLHNGISYQKSASQEPELIRLETTDSNKYSDEIVLYFQEGKNDGLKFLSMNSAIPQIYALDDTSKMSIFKIDPSSFSNNKVIPLVFVCKNNGEYVINAKELSFNNNIDVKLVDNVSSDTIDLRKQSGYKFNYNTNETGARFNLLLNSKSAVKIANVSKPAINVWGNNKKLFVNLPFDGNSTLEVYNVEGKKINLKELKNKGIHTLSMNSNGLYLVRIIHYNIVYVSKVFIQ